MRFGVPLELVRDRGTHFLNNVITELTDQYHINHWKTTPNNPKANGLTERANGIICKLLTKVVTSHKTDLDRKLTSAVYAYNTAHKSTTGKTPYFLVFGQEVLQVVQTEIEMFRVLLARYGDRTDDPHQRLEDIDALEEYRMDALEKTAMVQEQRKQIYDRKLPPETNIMDGDLVLLFDSSYRDFPGNFTLVGYDRFWLARCTPTDLFGLKI